MLSDDRKSKKTCYNYPQTFSLGGAGRTESNSRKEDQLNKTKRQQQQHNPFNGPLSKTTPKHSLIHSLSLWVVNILKLISSIYYGSIASSFVVVGSTTKQRLLQKLQEIQWWWHVILVQV